MTWILIVWISTVWSGGALTIPDIVSEKACYKMGRTILEQLDFGTSRIRYLCLPHATAAGE